MFDEHEACRKEMQRIHNEWDKAYHKSVTINTVILENGDRQDGTWDRRLIITRICRDENGITIFVR